MDAAFTEKLVVLATASHTLFVVSPEDTIVTVPPPFIEVAVGNTAF